MEEFILWLISLEITNNNKIKLIKEYGNEKEIFDNFEEILKKYNRIAKKTSNYTKYDKLKKVKELKSIFEEKNIRYITITDSKYPECLKNIQDPPYVLFYKGDITLLNTRMVSIVGSRRNTIYGERVTRFIAKELSSLNVTVVSGGALGIDSIAHRECLRNKGKTIAVLGCGIDIIYPSKNRSLFNSIYDEGLIISEFLPGTKPFNYNFPRRNRIISGLSELTIVTEASKKSGSLITVGYALDQGKEVAAVPSSIFQESGNGCNMLIKEGANLILNRADLHDILGIKENEIKEKNTLVENKLLNIINNEPMHIDDIFRNAKVDRNTFYKLLFEMQIKNEILSLPGDYYVRVI